MPQSATQPDDAEAAADLARRITAGDPAAESELVARYRRGLELMLRRTARDPELALDLCQETFRIVLERLRGRGLAEPEKLIGFLHATARNLLIAGHRKTARRRTDADEEALGQVVDPAPSQLGRVLQNELAGRVQQLLGELDTDRDRELLYRFYVAEDDKNAICHDLGLTSLHFNRVLFRARQRFKELLEKSWVR